METLGGSIPIEPEYKASKEVVVPLSTAVARENNRGSITSAQRAGQATARSGPESGPGSGPANSSSRQRRQRKAVQERQPEPVRTRKRKSVEGIGEVDIEEVDLGPRKLRSRK
jgi:hypothetical protein